MKPANVLINGEGLVVKICDFGLARVIEDLVPIDDEPSEEEMEEEAPQTPSMANEVMANEVKMDIE